LAETVGMAVAQSPLGCLVLSVCQLLALPQRHPEETTVPELAIQLMEKHNR